MNYDNWKTTDPRLEEADAQDLERVEGEEEDERQHQLELRNERAEQVRGEVERGEHYDHPTANDPARSEDWRDFAGDNDGEEL
jgi:hypothetical protein